MFALWVEFITAHANNDLINSKTNMVFNEEKNFDGKPKFLLAQEFFKRLGGILEDELKKLAVYLLNKTEMQTSSQKLLCTGFMQISQRLILLKI